jgi:hypothetical protein
MEGTQSQATGSSTDRAITSRLASFPERGLQALLRRFGLTSEESREEISEL